MAEEGGGGGEKSQAPTPHKIQKAREEGNVAQSREILLLVSLGTFLLIFVLTIADATKQFLVSMQQLISQFWTIQDDPVSIYRLARQALNNGLAIAIPFMVVGAATVIFFGMLQTGFLFRPQALKIDPKRLSPLKGIKRIFSLNNIIELLKNIFKFSAFALVLYGVAYKAIDISPQTERWTSFQLIRQVGNWFVYATSLILLVQCVITVLDEVWSRYRHFSKLKMSLQEVKDELKQTEGDPAIKSRIRQIRVRRSRQRMMNSVKESTVIIVNPTHYSVALRYDSSSGTAPQLVAKGVDDLAFRIRDVAKEAKVPIISNPPLARALYKLPLETEIPEEFWKPVAAIIAYIIKLKTPGSRSGTN
ncbi:flagellar type III secretion system protein FlhB (plasmid) [Aristophania vespae]|uniref:Flagellar type III secretion system protein FlhB n=1 Tax=Aristophania vespae TaxID=2697033 RepID=A0A6P1NDV0_9PROT|nr:EscU/YscU/HrcU family type III secretion system export apparatus switch protein [Aristophania vespae]QHI96496.1 flagellar type III secretion system protein FlhB [Aristophania vespae]UMM64818.1 Flagellar biosynthetic protein FlhB [Aristophania vespae]